MSIDSHQSSYLAQLFRDQGYGGPTRVLSREDAMKTYCDALMSIKQKPVCPDADAFDCRERSSSLLLELACSPIILDVVEEIIGKDILLWHSYLFLKLPGSLRTPWHQDHDYLQLNPIVNVSVWILLAEATGSNAGFWLIPNSHNSDVDHVGRNVNLRFQAAANEKSIDTAQAKEMFIQPGECIFFHSKMLHYSPPNLSLLPRLAFVVRYCPANIAVIHDQIFSGHTALRVRGQATYSANRVDDM